MRSTEHGIITMREIGPGKSGNGGKFGNQIFKYAFLRIYASHYRLKFETSPWPGQYLFGHQDPPITHRFPQITRKEMALKDLFKHEYPPYVKVDLKKQYFFLTKFYRPFRGQFRSLFQPTAEVYSMVNPGLVKLQRMGKTIVGIHIRRGDYLEYHNHPRYWIAPSKWYLQWLNQIWPTLIDPVLFIASDDLTNILPEFRHYRPVTSKELIPKFPSDVSSALGIKLDTSFFPDYYLLTQCDYLAISNSTFSFSASMLNKRCTTFMRPDLNNQKLIQYDPWNSEPKLSFKADQS